MKSRFFTPLDSSDSWLNTAWDEIYPHALTSVGNNGGGASTPVPVVPPTPTAPSEAVEAKSAQSGPTTVVAETSGGITINLLFDAAAMAAPASFRAGIEQAAAILSATITNQITVNINIDYSGTGGGAAAGPDNGAFVNYSTVRADLINDAAPGDTTFNPLPTGPTFQGQSSVAVWNAQLKALGLLAPTANTDDGGATFATDINSNLLVGVALHELTHALGRVSYGPTQASPSTTEPDIFDFFRFTAPGMSLILGGATAPAAYFSLDGGNTKLADFGQTSDSSDFLNSGVQGPNDPFNEFYTGSTSQTLTTVDIQILDALGFHATTPVTTVIESFGSTKLVQLGISYYLDSINSGTGPELKDGGAPVVVGQFGTIAPIGAEQTASGYDIAWQVPGTNQFTFWTTDSSGNYTSNITGLVSGNSFAVESLETTFGQDLNGDGTIGVTASLIKTDGTTSLLQIADNYYAYVGGVGPELKYGGAAVTVGEFGNIAPIGAVQTASGYDIAWQIPGTNEFTFWTTDSNGNYTSNITGLVTGADATLKSLELTFHQDFNGDGVIGLSSSVIDVTGHAVLTPSALAQPAAIEAGSTLELAGADSASVTFESSTGALILDHSSIFTGQIIGFAGNGNLVTSDQIDLKDISFGPGTTDSFTGNSADGTLTITDAQNHTANILLVGNYVGSTFALSGDGSGGTVVVDPPATQDLASGRLSFGSSHSDAQSLSVSAQSGGSGYVGDFTVEAASIANGQEAVGWHFDLDSSSIRQSVTQSYEVTVADNQANGAVSAAAQTASVTIGGPGNDSFVFHPGFGADVIANAKSPDTIELDGFSSVTSDFQLATFLHEAQAGQSQSLFHTANDAHDTTINLANHDSITLMNVRLADLHGGNFAIG